MGTPVASDLNPAPETDLYRFDAPAGDKPAAGNTLIASPDETAVAPTYPMDIPLAEPFHDTRAIELHIGPIEKPILHSPSVLSMGNPHAIFWVDAVRGYDLAKIGPLLEAGAAVLTDAKLQGMVKRIQDTK